MAEITSGAVSSLLGLLQKEAQLLGGVGSDVDFIREEMESMNSFLEHLSRTAHHDERVRTWMGQVQSLVNDCNGCINDYLLSGDLAVHIAMGGRLRRYAWWTYWLLQKAVAQHRAAMRLRELKDRISDVSSRRLRYAVEIPAGTAEDDEEEEDQVPATAGAPRRRALEPCTVEDFCADKLADWFRKLRAGRRQDEGVGSIPSIAIVAQDADAWAAAAQGALGLAAAHFEESVSINLQALHHAWDLPLLPQEILCYILRECRHQGSTDLGGRAEEKYKPWRALREREITYREIRHIDRLDDVHDKINQVKSNIGEVVRGIRIRTIAEAESNKTDKRFKATAGITLDEPLEVLRQALQLTLDMPGPSMIQGSLEDTLQEAAAMLKMLVEAAGGVPEHPIQLNYIQYQDILRKVFLDSKLPQQAQETGTTNTATTLGDEAHIKEILKIALENHKIALDIMRELLARPQLQEGNSVMEQATKETEQKMDNSSWEKTKANSAAEAIIKETMDKVEEISWKIQVSLLINGIVAEIDNYLGSKKTLIILTDDSDYISQWEGIRNALSLLACACASAVIVITKNNQRAKEFWENWIYTIKRFKL